MALNLKHQSKDQLLVRIWERYRVSKKEETAKIAKFILDNHVNGDFTDAQIRNAAGHSAAQWATLKAKMETLVAKYNDLNNAAGE